MKTNLESEILVGEIFVIKNNQVEMPKPILADVKRVESVNDWQRVFMSALSVPHNGYEISTQRIVEDGVYCDRSKRYQYIRLDTVGFDRLGDFFTQESIQELLQKVSKVERDFWTRRRLEVESHLVSGGLTRY